jgi:hypothetical protein
VERIIADRRASTLTVYNAKWTVFESWCKHNDIDALCCAAPSLADFFIFLFEEKNLAVSTIRGYRSAISKVYRVLNLPDPGQDLDLSALIRNFQLHRPRSQRLVPKWDLDVVLAYLDSDVFKPLESITLRALTLKTVFLMVMATAARVSEIHALCRQPPCLQWLQNAAVRLKTAPGFLAKNRLPEDPSLSWTLEPLLDTPSLCPVTLLKMYLQKTSQFFSATAQDSTTIQPLFVRCDGKAKASPQLLSEWIRCVIIAAYKAKLGTSTAQPDQTRLAAADVQPVRPGARLSSPLSSTSATSSSQTRMGGRASAVEDLAADPALCNRGPPPLDLSRPAHELRAIAASLAYCKGAALSDVVHAVGWSSSCTFATFYLRSVEDVAAPQARLPAERRRH